MAPLRRKRVVVGDGGGSTAVLRHAPAHSSGWAASSCSVFKRWQSGDMCLRGSAAGMLEAEQQFRKIIG